MQDDLFPICLRAIPSLTLSASHFIITDDWHTEDLLRPVFMGCATKNVKVITIALGSLQRLIALRAVSLSAIPAIIQTMNDCISQGVDIQLKILQTLLSLITNFPTIHGRLLANVRAFVLCSYFFSLTDGPTGIRREIGPPSVFQAA
jgi:Dimerisation and cyclophilin-binding domain of Mon2